MSGIVRQAADNPEMKLHGHPFIPRIVRQLIIQMRKLRLMQEVTSSDHASQEESPALLTPAQFSFHCNPAVYKDSLQHLTLQSGTRSPASDRSILQGFKYNSYLLVCTQLPNVHVVSQPIKDSLGDVALFRSCGYVPYPKFIPGMEDRLQNINSGLVGGKITNDLCFPL